VSVRPGERAASAAEAAYLAFARGVALGTEPGPFSKLPDQVKRTWRSVADAVKKHEAERAEEQG
jgi:hypothetical protein